MKFKKILFFFQMLALILCGCSNSYVKLEKLSTTSNEIKLIINSERDLNDLITFRYEPQNATNKDVIYSCEENDIFLLDGSHITANKIGSAFIKATSVDNINLSIDIKVKVYDPLAETYNVFVNESDEFNVIGLDNEYEKGATVSFTVDVIKENKIIDFVKVDNEIINANNNVYNFIMPSNDVHINIVLKDIIINTIKATNVSLISEESLYVGEEKVIEAIVEPLFTTDIPSWHIVKGEDVIKLTSNNHKATLKGLKKGEAIVKVSYNENVYKECRIIVNEKNNQGNNDYLILAKYDIKYDLGTRKTAKQIIELEDLFNTFVLSEGDSIISSVAEIEYIYGGGNGGRNETAWYRGDILKFGTTSVNGSLSLKLNKEINRIKINGFVNAATSEIQVGDSLSTSWNGGKEDNRTSMVTCSSMHEATKEVMEANNTSSIIIDFALTKDLKIATTNKKPLYINSIEFMCSK